MDGNRLITDDFSNPATKAMHAQRWPDEPELAEQCWEDALQCGGCAYFAPFNMDFGLCCHSSSRHHLETVFEHFTCAAIVNEGWGAHSFTEDVVTREVDDDGEIISDRAPVDDGCGKASLNYESIDANDEAAMVSRVESAKGLPRERARPWWRFW